MKFNNASIRSKDIGSKFFSTCTHLSYLWDLKTKCVLSKRLNAMLGMYVDEVESDARRSSFFLTDSSLVESTQEGGGEESY